jgi:hypothetical protein
MLCPVTSGMTKYIIAIVLSLENQEENQKKLKNKIQNSKV